MCAIHQHPLTVPSLDYPAWIVGKRASAGLKPMPDKLQNLYKGGGVMWLSLGPTCMIEDYATTFFGQYTDSKLLASAGSGVIGESAGHAILLDTLVRSHHRRPACVYLPLALTHSTRRSRVASH